MQLQNNYPSGAANASAAPYSRVLEKIVFTTPPNPPLDGGNWTGVPQYLYGNSAAVIFDYKQVGIGTAIGKDLGEVIMEYDQELGVQYLDVCGNTVVTSIGSLHFKARWVELDKYKIEITH